MTSNQTNPEPGDETQEDDILAVYGSPEAESDDLSQLAGRHRKFAPWHHPVKQIVRDCQFHYKTEPQLWSKIEPLS